MIEAIFLTWKVIDPFHCRPPVSEVGEFDDFRMAIGAVEAASEDRDGGIRGDWRKELNYKLFIVKVFEMKCIN